jgi:tRNA pseudouridine38-40 synthase
VRRFRLLLEFDGTDFSGWQTQPHGRSVQDEVEQALLEITRESRRVTPSGRTDAGVHATGQVAHFDSETRLEPAALGRGLNAVLPRDVSVLGVELAAPDFHARRDATSKLYVYRILNREAPSPVRARFTWHMRAKLDPAAMAEAAASVVGTHDFSAFRGAPGGVDTDMSPRRTLHRLDVRELGDEIRIEADGRSFLRHMVRNLAATLVEVGLGRRLVSDMAKVLESRDRAKAAATAPAHGLCLERVRYASDDAR